MAKTDLFLSHNWSPDEKGRNNHDRVSVINEALKKLGYKCWFDRYFFIFWWGKFWTIYFFRENILLFEFFNDLNVGIFC